MGNTLIKTIISIFILVPVVLSNIFSRKLLTSVTGYNLLKLPENKAVLQSLKNPDTKFYVFQHCDAPTFLQYMLINDDGGYGVTKKRTLGFLRQISEFNRKLSELQTNGNETDEVVNDVRKYLISYFSTKLARITTSEFVEEIGTSSHSQIVHLMKELGTQRIKNMLLNTVWISEYIFNGSPQGFIAVAYTNNKIEMSVTVHADPRWIRDNKSKQNKFQVHLFIARDEIFIINRILKGQPLTSQLSFSLHCAGLTALNAQHIVTAPLPKMKELMLSSIVQINDGEQIQGLFEDYNDYYNGNGTSSAEDIDVINHFNQNVLGMHVGNVNVKSKNIFLQFCQQQVTLQQEWRSDQ